MRVYSFIKENRNNLGITDYQKCMLTVNSVWTLLATGASSGSSEDPDPFCIAYPPMGIMGWSGRFSRFLRSWLRSLTSNKFRPEISVAIFSNFAEYILSTPSGVGIRRGSEGVASPAAVDWRATLLKLNPNIHFVKPTKLG